MIPKPCLEPGCGKLTDGGSYCPEHKREGFSRGRTGARGTTAKWRRLRTKILERDGHRCVYCHTDVALEVHHVNGDPTDDRETNLETVCKNCHRKHHRAMRGRSS
jgi:5-methylcytosine-specific restriction endonuclease McrA